MSVKRYTYDANNGSWYDEDGNCPELDATLCLATDYNALAKRLEEAERLMRQAVTPHQFNCGTVKHPDFIKLVLVPVYKCTCGLDAFLE